MPGEHHGQPEVDHVLGGQFSRPVPVGEVGEDVHAGVAVIAVHYVAGVVPQVFGHPPPFLQGLQRAERGIAGVQEPVPFRVGKADQIAHRAQGVQLGVLGDQVAGRPGRLDRVQQFVGAGTEQPLPVCTLRGLNQGVTARRSARCRGPSISIIVVRPGPSRGGQSSMSGRISRGVASAHRTSAYRVSAQPSASISARRTRARVAHLREYGRAAY
ncbi:hypothetical protein [Amycolatopsis anabasis]|uniref:hypothetical protein n=1 Tax=Amycolatopsis anabasis TaxID=1840409 RepID=UPI00131BF026|nr:hypothetical protein [Amycolatopsis anabasis]